MPNNAREPSRISNNRKFYFVLTQKLLLEWNLLSDEEKRPYEDEYQEYLEKEEEGLKGFSPDGEIPGELWVGTANGQILKRNVQEISVQRMRTRGCRVMKVQEGDCIVAAARQYRIRVRKQSLRQRMRIYFYKKLRQFNLSFSNYN